ncbi:MAG: hypothetical protein MJ231_00485 [bacterium]|nr:hypothetical protein [bacterium]
MNNIKVVNLIAKINFANMAKVLFMCLFFVFGFLPSYAFEDCIVTADGKLTDISIDDNTIIDVYPLITIMGEKHTLMVHPLKMGSTHFSVLKDKKTKINLKVDVTDVLTRIECDDKNVEIQTMDIPPATDNFRIDVPPYMMRGVEQWIN